MMPSVMHFVIFSFSLLGSSCIEPDYYWREGKISRNKPTELR